MPELHEHLHLFGDGLRAFVHAHDRPSSGAEGSAMRVHRHVNGQHAHPHGHAEYRLLPASHDRRPIEPARG